MVAKSHGFSLYPPLVPGLDSSFRQSGGSSCSPCCPPLSCGLAHYICNQTPAYVGAEALTYAACFYSRFSITRRASGPGSTSPDDLISICSSPKLRMRSCATPLCLYLFPPLFSGDPCPPRLPNTPYFTEESCWIFTYSKSERGKWVLITHHPCHYGLATKPAGTTVAFVKWGS